MAAWMWIRSISQYICVACNRVTVLKMLDSVNWFMFSCHYTLEKRDNWYICDVCETGFIVFAREMVCACVCVCVYQCSSKVAHAVVCELVVP